MDFPWIFHGGRRPTNNVGGSGGAGAPPHEEAKVLEEAKVRGRRTIFESFL